MEAKFNKERIRHVDATPNENYAVRILEAYLKNAKNGRWEANPSNDLVDKMNEHQEERVELLEDAINTLNTCSCGEPDEK